MKKIIPFQVVMRGRTTAMASRRPARPRKMSMAGMTLGVSNQALEQSGTYGDRLHLFCSTQQRQGFHHRKIWTYHDIPPTPTVEKITETMETTEIELVGPL